MITKIDAGSVPECQPREQNEVSNKGEGWGRRFIIGWQNLSAKLYEIGAKIFNFLTVHPRDMLKSLSPSRVIKYEGFANDDETAQQINKVVDQYKRSTLKISEINYQIRSQGGDFSKISPDIQQSIREDVVLVQSQFEKVKEKLSQIAPEKFKEFQSKLTNLTQTLEKSRVRLEQERDAELARLIKHHAAQPKPQIPSGESYEVYSGQIA